MKLPTVHPFLAGLLQGSKASELICLVRDDQDWDQITEDAAAQGLLPWLYRRLIASDAGPHPSLPRLERIKARAAGIAATNALLAHELAAILRRCKASQVRCVPLRGLALAERLYGDISLRPMGDLDLLVPRNDLPRVAEILTDLGFQELDRRPGFARTYSYTLEFFKDRHGWVIVEPHWSVAYPPFTDRVEMETVWERCVKGRAVGVETWLLGREDLFVHLCYHVLHKGTSAPLLWLYELDRLTRHQEEGGLDWALIVRMAQQAGQGLLLAEVLVQLREHFGSPIPDQVIAHLMGQQTSPLTRLMASEPDVDGRESVALLFTLKGVRTKLRYAFGLLFPSPEFMRIHYGLSGGVRLGLCYFIRVLQLSWGGLRGMADLFVSRYTTRHRL